MATIEKPATFAAPGEPGSAVTLKARYENFIGGHWVAPIDGEYRPNLTPVTGEPFCEVAHSGAAAIEDNLEMLAVAESWENGKPVRETLAADIPLAVDPFRYFAGATRSLEGSSTEIDKDTVAFHFHEPLG